MRRAASLALAALYASLAWGQPAAPAAPVDEKAPATFKDPMIDVITALNAAPITPGECASYVNGTANAVLCVQKATTTAANTVLVSLAPVLERKDRQRRGGEGGPRGWGLGGY